MEGEVGWDVLVKKSGHQVKLPKVKEKPQSEERRQFLKDSVRAVSGGMALGVAIKTGLAEAFLRAIFQSASGEEKPIVKTDVIAKAEATRTPEPPKVFNLVFGGLPPEEKTGAQRQVEATKNLLINHSSYNRLLAVTTQWEGVIRQETRRVGFPEELALGIIFIENGGGEDLKSSAGARGVAQLMPETAKRYGLRVNDWVDERANPAKSITVMCNYLKDNLDRFAGNLGLTVWSYHAGEGNVYNALREYFLSVGEKDPGYIVGAKTDQEAVEMMENYRRLIGQKKANVHQVLSNPRVVQNVLKRFKLGDETELYVYKAVAAAELFAETKQNHSSPRS